MLRIIIQARLSSKRLPHKVLAPIQGYSTLDILIFKSKLIANTIVAIPEDELILADWLKKRNCQFSLGSHTNVLDRFLVATHDMCEHEYLVRLTADNPMVDFILLKRAIEYTSTQIENPIDYFYCTGLPLGMGFEIIRIAALRAQQKFNLLPSDYEHVTTAIKRIGKPFNIQSKNWGAFSTYPNKNWQDEIRLTMDTHADLNTLINVATSLGNWPSVDSKEILKLYKDKPSLFSANIHIKQKSALSYESSKTSNCDY